MYTPVAFDVALDQAPPPSPQSMPRKIMVGLLALGVVIGVVALMTSHSTPTADNAADSELFRKTSSTWSGSDLSKNHVAGSNVCTSSEVATLKAGMKAFEPAITKAVGKEGSNWQWTSAKLKDFKQFFGNATTKKDNGDVISILKDAQRRFLKFDSTAKPGKAISGDWGAECCNYTAGSTDLCKQCFTSTGAWNGVMAFTRVMSNTDGTASAGRTLRFCPYVFASKLLPTTVGLVIFHELIHMVTGGEVIDMATYQKIGMTNKAKTKGGSDVTRLTANAYTMFVAKAGFSHKIYDKTTYLWGQSIEDVQSTASTGGCTDLLNTASCNIVVTAGCNNYFRLNSGGIILGEVACCKSCKGK